MNKFDSLELFEKSLSEVKDIKTIKLLVQVGGGLGDALGTLEGALFFANKCGFEPRQIYWKSPSSYANLNEYLIFKEINYINSTCPIKHEDFTHVLQKVDKRYCTLTKNLKFKLRDYLTFNSLIEEESNKYTRDIGLHIRIKEYEHGRKLDAENKIKLLEDAYNSIVKKFESIYDPKQQYFVSTDSPLINDYLNKYANLVYIPKQTFLHYLEYELKNTPYLPVLDLAILSKCKEIYRLGSNSGYPILATSLSKNDSIRYIG